jgi:hypothetical protein
MSFLLGTLLYVALVGALDARIDWTAKELSR